MCHTLQTVENCHIQKLHELYEKQKILESFPNSKITRCHPDANIYPDQHPQQQAFRHPQHEQWCLGRLVTGCPSVVRPALYNPGPRSSIVHSLVGSTDVAEQCQSSIRCAR